MKNSQITDLLYQSLETEIGGVQVYKTALGCAVTTAIGASRAEQSRDDML